MSEKLTRSQWLRKYPNHCKSCEGHTDSGNPCRSCLMNYLTCPRCGKRDTLHPEDATVPCSSCGWVEGADMGCPPSREMIREEKQRRQEEAERERWRQIRHHEAELKRLRSLP